MLRNNIIKMSIQSTMHKIIINKIKTIIILEEVRDIHKTIRIITITINRREQVEEETINNAKIRKSDVYQKLVYNKIKV